MSKLYEQGNDETECRVKPRADVIGFAHNIRCSNHLVIDEIIEESDYYISSKLSIAKKHLIFTT